MIYFQNFFDRVAEKDTVNILLNSENFAAKFFRKGAQLLRRKLTIVR